MLEYREDDCIYKNSHVKLNILLTVLYTGCHNERYTLCAPLLVVPRGHHIDAVVCHIETCLIDAVGVGKVDGWIGPLKKPHGSVECRSVAIEGHFIFHTREAGGENLHANGGLLQSCQRGVREFYEANNDRPQQRDEEIPFHGHQDTVQF